MRTMRTQCAGLIVRDALIRVRDARICVCDAFICVCDAPMYDVGDTLIHSMSERMLLCHESIRDTTTCVRDTTTCVRDARMTHSHTHKYSVTYTHNAV